MPMPGSPDWGEAYGDWARRVQIDLAALKAYAEAVYAATDTYLACLCDDDLGRELDLGAVGFGTQKLGWVLSLLVLNHIGTETGEISVLKGIQGAGARLPGPPTCALVTTDPLTNAVVNRLGMRRLDLVR